MLAEDTFQSINNPVTAGQQRQVCALPIHASTRFCRRLSCFGNLQKAFAAPICAATLPRCPAAIHNRYPEMQGYFSPQLLQPMLGTPEEFAAVIKADAQKWGTIIRNAHLSLQ